MKRLELCYKSTIKRPIENNPIYKLIFNYEDKEEIEMR